MSRVNDAREETTVEGDAAGADRAMRDNVLQSVEAARSAIVHMKRNLERGGFASSVDVYKKMTGTLVGQRLWARNREDTELENAFALLAAAATQVHGLLEPYVDQMKQLSVLSDLKPGDVDILIPQAPPTGVDGTILEMLERSDRPLSVSRLRAGTRLPSRELDEALDGLEGAGLVRIIRSGGRRRVVIGPDAGRG